MTKQGLIAAILFSVLAMGCSSGDGGHSADPTPVSPAPIKKVTESVYLSGTKFCQTYSEITGQEFGIRVSVPQDYDHPEKGELSIYAYTVKPFDPAKPSYIYVDGGPGQNTHGMMPEYLNGNYNEIRFDQRGLGCSAPETWAQYKDSSLYSSLNTIRDMDLIRQAYGIAQWTVYGVSYGTVPSTMYGSVYPASTKAVVLEGTVGTLEHTHLMSYKIEKLNLVLQKLNADQRWAFSKMLNDKNSAEDVNFIFSVVFELFYSDVGMRKAVTLLNQMIEPSGKVRKDVIDSFRQKMAARDNRFQLPQQPGAVDENILTIIYCKNLGMREKKATSLDYTYEDGFIETPAEGDGSEACDEVNVKAEDEKIYNIADYKVSVPVYYFQGSHDGATQAVGAINHWKTVPQGPSFFLLAQKGGHNPNLTRLESKSSYVASEEHKLFEKAIAATPISAVDLSAINLYQDSAQKWLLYTNPKAVDLHIEDELKGIKARYRF